jgi:hypothetical protein
MNVLGELLMSGQAIGNKSAVGIDESNAAVGVAGGNATDDIVDPRVGAETMEIEVAGTFEGHAGRLVVAGSLAGLSEEKMNRGVVGCDFRRFLQRNQGFGRPSLGKQEFAFRQEYAR